MSETRKIFTGRVILQMVLVVLAAPFIPMIISGDWNWWGAWAYAVASILAFVISRVFAGRHHPDLLAERARFMEAKDTKAWDKVLAPLLDLVRFLFWSLPGWIDSTAGHLLFQRE